MPNEPQTVPIHPTILPWQENRLRQYMKAHGMVSVSEALRRILTEFFAQADRKPVEEEPA